MPAETPPKRRFGGAVAVGAGIFLSRIAGLVRTRVIAHYIGQKGAADAFAAALRIPNLLQNLFGEGVLSASFIPVYARLRAEGRDDDASRLARAVGTLLALTALVITIGGVLAARPVVNTLIPGAEGAERELTVTLLRITFPGVALLVLSAWCLGVLNSHRKFFLSYVSPVLWNAALIAVAFVAGRRFFGHKDEIVVWLAWGAVIGSAAQFLIQLPTVIAILRSLRPSLAVRDEGVQQTLRAFVPIVLGRGSVQLSGYIDQALASYLGEGFVAAMANAQILYLLPVSLFGMAVSAAELPEMSSALGDESERAAVLQKRLASALRQVVFLVVPSAIAFIAIGEPIVALLFQGGQFGPDATHIVWIMLAGSAIGLSAGTQGRLLASAFYALGDPTRPLYAALVRVSITGVAGYVLALGLRNALGSSALIPFSSIPGIHEVILVIPGYAAKWGAFGLTASAGFAAWIEFLLLRRWLARRIGAVPIPTTLGLGCLAAALAAGAAAFATNLLVGELVPNHIAPRAIAAIAVFGIVYFAIATIAKIPEAHAFTGKITRRFRRR
ncbi:MAG TPA: murein biosynthesis integral membrane protein MurJ [Kofleriaceae bacterium]|nr:murein biosynthesis integral membrane protein MurJ [Kofleriaceae bacterium]